MAYIARKPIGSAHNSLTSNYQFASYSTDASEERHYSVSEIADLWSLSEKTVRRLFEGQAGVIQFGSQETLHKRGYRTLRVPESVLHRVHRTLSKAS